jgi:PleD family two-component response regulator
MSTISLADGGVMLKAAAQAPGISRQGKGPRVLVVEDNAINRRILGAFLAKRGFEWSEAHDGQEGVDVFSSTPHNHWE